MFLIVKSYMENGFENIDFKINESKLQKMLWLCDFLGLDKFSDFFVLVKVIPCINKRNCLVFLNEFINKKLH